MTKQSNTRLAGSCWISHDARMFLVTESDATAIRAAYEQSGELAAAVELRRRFKGITDNEKARACVRSIVGWKPRPAETQDTPA
jgi:hypothetical protein